MEPKLIKFKIVGIVCSPEYQKCKLIAKQLHHTFPRRFGSPELRPMLDVAWLEFRTKLRRRNLHGMAPWCTEQPVAVFTDKGKYIGDCKELEKFIDKNYTLRVCKDFEELGLVNLKAYLDKFEVLFTEN